MGTVSYSQVGEDLQIAYFLGQTRGVTYIDAGCLWPVQHSNSYFFYERGGRGLCIDANPSVAGDWAATRPHDAFLNVGLGDAVGELTYHTFANPVFNTFSAQRAQRVVAQSATKPGRQPTGSAPVEVITLDEAIRRTGFVERCGGELGFLSIDVEGLEEQVLSGFDFDVLRPRVVVCEHLRGRRDKERVEDGPMGARMREMGYEVGGYTGHDVYFVDAA